MSEAVKILVVVQGGIVTSVSGLGVPIVALVMDFDNADDDDAMRIPNCSGLATVEPPEHTDPLTTEEIVFLEPHWEA